MADFADHLATGRVTEGAIANWVRSRGGVVFPVYEREIYQGKGPQFFAPGEELLARDLVAFHSFSAAVSHRFAKETARHREGPRDNGGGVG